MKAGLPLFSPTTLHPVKLRSNNNKTGKTARNFFINFFLCICFCSKSTSRSKNYHNFIRKNALPIPLVWGQMEQAVLQYIYNAPRMTLCPERKIHTTHFRYHCNTTEKIYQLKTSFSEKSLCIAMPVRLVLASLWSDDIPEVTVRCISHNSTRQGWNAL